MVTRRDPVLRLGDYQRSLRTWLSSGILCDVVFCDNSGYDIASLKEIGAGYHSGIEFISYSGNQSGAARGKGHAELEMMKHVINVSTLLREAEIIVKCTGRLSVRNAAKIIPGIGNSDFDVMCTLKRNLSFADSRLFAATPQFIMEYLLPLGESIDDNVGLTLEHGLAQATARAISERKRWCPFPYFPAIEGVSGSDGIVMTNSVLKRVSKALYHRARNFVYRN